MMEDDTRQSNTSPKEDLSKEALNLHPENKPFTGSQWNDPKATPYRPTENANLMAGGTQHTAGGGEVEVSLKNALTVGVPITEIHKRPCVRDSLLKGMIGGFAIGGVRIIFGTPVFKACSWAVGTFCGVSGSLYQYCLYQRNAEKEGMRKAIEIINKRQMEQAAKEERKAKLREERRAAKEKELEAQYKTSAETGGRPWYKFW